MADPNQYIPQGQTPLTLPMGPWGQGQWQGSGGGNTAAQYYTVQEFQNLFGREPTQSELDQFSNYYIGADPNIANQGGGNQAISSYYNQQQQAANAPQQEEQAIQQQIPIINNLVNSQMQGSIENLTNPNSPAFQQFSGNLNNYGITPSSGAFQAGLGGTLANDANQDITAALGQVGLPLASTYSQGQAAPFTQAMQQPQSLFTNNQDLQAFLQQMTAGQNLQNKMQPSGFQTAFGDVTSGLTAGGNAAQGGAAAYKATWICTAMKNHGLITQEDIYTLHAHLFRAFWKMPIKFLSYMIFGNILVHLAEKSGIDWKIWKPGFYDEVMRESDPVKAVALYEDSFWSLYRIVKWRLRKNSMLVYHKGSN